MFGSLNLEDIRFYGRLKHVTQPVLLDACVITDSRKFYVSITMLVSDPAAYFSNKPAARAT